MIPLRDTAPTRNYPLVNTCLIGLNVAVFMLQLSRNADIERFIYIYGLVPARYSIPQIAAYFSTGQQVFSFLSFMFLHGGFWHLLGNMWFLYIFGDNVEDRLGHGRYLIFYLVCGMTSGLSHLLLNFNSNVPTIGASGAIAGVMGAYFILHPRARILTLIPIFFIPYFLEIPAFFFIGFWFVMQFISAAASHGQAGGVAWWAHIGGFVFGIIFFKLFLMLPGTPVPDTARRVTARRKSPHLQVIRPVGPGMDPHLYGTIVVSPHEAVVGTRKLVNIPWGFHKRLLRVNVPPQIQQGATLRLKGLGKEIAPGQRGDLFLKVVIRE
jgi:membrane associated rhomboid family serine protease